eukprot:2837033-Amphidinium_carterae.1
MGLTKGTEPEVDVTCLKYHAHIDIVVCYLCFWGVTCAARYHCGRLCIAATSTPSNMQSGSKSQYDVVNVLEAPEVVNSPTNRHGSRRLPLPWLCVQSPVNWSCSVALIIVSWLLVYTVNFIRTETWISMGWQPTLQRAGESKKERKGKERIEIGHGDLTRHRTEERHRTRG